MAHIHELYDFTVSAFIVHDGRVLLLHHKKLNAWLQPGGHVELDEDPEMALWRELEEETGLTQNELVIVELQKNDIAATISDTNKRLPMPFDFNVHPFGNDSSHRHIDMSYLMKSNTSKIQQNLLESNDLRWFSLEDIEAIKDELLPDIYARTTFALNVAL